MPRSLQFSAPHMDGLVSCDQQALTPRSVGVRTWYSRMSVVIEQYGALRSPFGRVADLDRRERDTIRRLLATAPPASPFPESPTRSN